MQNDKLGFVGLAVLVALVVGVVGGYYYGDGAGYRRGDGDGYKRAQADVKKSQEEAARLAAESAAKAANPFGAQNPLQGVEANPFEKTKKALNPFD
ncbi:hypothetical protein HY504_01435 [Candidatus Wolfebacteria bacterium]|nr:hypothetical protein [Candidatus Wolfebacteria bacterium]